MNQKLSRILQENELPRIGADTSPEIEKLLANEDVRRAVNSVARMAIRGVWPGDWECSLAEIFQFHADKQGEAVEK